LTTPTRTTPERRGEVRIGVAGWSYPDWRGTFYPERPGAGFDELRFAAERFDCLEINSTFYRAPLAKTCESWLRRIEDIDGFTFTAKLGREVTHGAGRGESAQLPSPSRALEICATFRGELAPLSDAGRLGAVIAQFPWHFDDVPAHRALLAAIAEGLSPLVVAVELRHVSFLESGPDSALRFLERHGIQFVNIDLPRSATAPPLTTINTGPLGYFRFHGRNSAAWFDPNAGRDRTYDYLYSAEELRQIVPAISRVAARTPVTYVITNNHFAGQAPANALQIIELLTARRPAAPESLARAFPFLTATRRESGDRAGGDS